MDLSDGPINALKISSREEKKYKLLKEGEQFEPGDLIHLYGEDYVKVNAGSQILKSKINKYNKVLRKIK